MGRKNKQILLSAPILFLIITSILYGFNQNTDLYNKQLSHVYPKGSSIGPSVNFTYIAVLYNDTVDKAFNTSLTLFLKEWNTIYGPPPTLMILNNSAGNNYGLSDLTILNGSLLIGTPGREITGIKVSGNEFIRTKWSNATIGSGWAIYGADIITSARALSFFALTMNPFDNWSDEVINSNNTVLLGGYGSINREILKDWKKYLPGFEAYMKRAVEHCITGFTVNTHLELLANMEELGYTEPDYKVYGKNATEMVVTLSALAASYHLKIYLSTDELVLTEAQYQWLMENLNYSGEKLKSDYPPHLHPDAPGLIEFLETKYNAVVDTIKAAANDTVLRGFGGFYFRTDDLSNDYPYKYAVLTTDEGFGRFINITCAAAQRINATVIQRVWRLGEKESIFNNVTVAEKILRPIKYTNLIIRCKETWNDHWYNHPPNPVIGTGGHPWIIGWYTGAALPDYKGIYYDTMFNEGNWTSNPYIIGFDLAPLPYYYFERLDVSTFPAANNFYLFMKYFYPNINGNETLYKFLQRVGIDNETIITQLTDIFNTVHEAFKLLCFWKVWSSSGKFTGDVLNNGKTVLFSPGRFSMFFESVINSPEYGPEYTIEEGFRGRDLAVTAYTIFPKEYNGIKLHPITEGYTDPEYASDPTNITQQLEALRGNLRHFADFSRFFAAYRAWFITYYEWGTFGNPIDWWRSELYRKETIEAYNRYMDIWGNVSYGYKASFTQINDYWIPLVGHLDTIRGLLIPAWIAVVIGAVLYVKLYLKMDKKGNSRHEKTGSGKKRKISVNTEECGIKKSIIGNIIFPALNIAVFIYTLNTVSGFLFTETVLIISIPLIAVSAAASIGVSVCTLIFCNKEMRKRMIIKGGCARGCGFLGSLIGIIPMLTVFTLGGIFTVTAGPVTLCGIIVPLILGIGISFYTVIKSAKKISEDGFRVLRYTAVTAVLAILIITVIILLAGGMNFIAEGIGKIENI